MLSSHYDKLILSVIFLVRIANGRNLNYVCVLKHCRFELRQYRGNNFFGFFFYLKIGSVETIREI